MTTKRIINFDSISEIDWARLAAYIDGEGCVTIANGTIHGERHDMYLQIHIVNVDPRLLVWCKNLLGGSLTIMRHGGKPSHRTCYSWTIRNKTAASVLIRCLPYFVIKREQAEIGIAFQQTKTRRGGSRPLSDSVFDLRKTYVDQIKQLKWKPHDPPSRADGSPLVH